MKAGKLLGLFLAFLLPSAMCSPETFRSPTMEALASKLKTFIASSPLIKPAYNCSLVHIVKSPETSLLDKIKFLSMPTLYKSDHKKEIVYVMKTNCGISHYTMYSKEQQGPIVQACLEKKFYSIPLPANLSCKFLYKADPDKDKLLPEFIQMRKAFVDSQAQYRSNKKQYTALTNICLDSLLKGNLHIGGLCYGLNGVLTRNFRTDDIAPDAREIFITGLFLDLLRPHCSNVDPKEAAVERICESYNKKRVFDCFIATIKNSFCRMVQHGSSYKTSSILKYYAHLHDLYNELQVEYHWLQELTLECVLNFKEDKCKDAMSGQQSAFLSQLKKYARAFYDNLVKAKAAAETTTTTTTARPTV